MRQQISEQLDGELDQVAAMRLRVHLATCPSCRRFARELKSITLRLRSVELEAVPPRTRRTWRTHVKLTASAVVTLAAASLIAIGLIHPTTNHEQPVLTSPGTQETLHGTDYDHTTHLA